MHKIKIFKSIRSDSLEKSINDWFKNNSNIDILFSDHFNDINGWYNLSLIYQEKDVGNDADEVD